DWSIQNSVRKSIAEDIKNYNEKLVQTAIKNNKNYKKANKALIIGKKLIIAIRSDNIRTTDRAEIINLVTKSYIDLDKAPETKQVQKLPPPSQDDIPEILVEEVDFHSLVHRLL
ncbi:hypothetical protein WA026_017759, partial [Henosepilachna vigintioctopunctata]